MTTVQNLLILSICVLAMACGGNREAIDIETSASPDEFVAVDVQPSFDYEDLQRRVRYPVRARRAGIEGQVLVGAYIGKDGKVEKTHIYSSDNEALNASAVAAVKGTVFTPALLKGVPVKLWVRIPIQYRLK